MGKTGIISLIFLLVFGGLVIQESPYWLWSIPFLVLGIMIPMVKGMWEVSSWITDQVNELKSEKYDITFSLDD